MTTVLFIISIFFASLFQGITGFGFSLMAAPLMLIFLDKQALVSSIVLIGIFLNLILHNRNKHAINKHIFYPILISIILAMPLGLLILKYISINNLKILFGGLSIIFSVLLYHPKFKFKENNFITIIAGIITGILHTSTAMSGPPLVLYLSGSGMPKHEFRKTLAVIFLLMNIISLPILFFGGVLSNKGIFLGLISLPFVIFAGILGDKISKFIPIKIFTLLQLGAVFVIGLTSIISGLHR